MPLQVEALHPLQNKKPKTFTTRQYVGLVRDINSSMAQMRPLFNDNQQLDESELVDSLANKAPISHKAMMISQVFNPETGDLSTFVEHYKRAETTDNIVMATFSASYEDSDTTKSKERSKNTKEIEDRGKKCRKTSSLYCILHGEKNSHTSREWKVLKKRVS